MSFISYEDGQAEFAEKRIKARKYKAKHTPKEYLAFLVKVEYFSMDHEHPQSTNYRNVFGFFCEPSQHVYGDSLQECLDKAIRKSK